MNTLAAPHALKLGHDTALLRRRNSRDAWVMIVCSDVGLVEDEAQMTDDVSLRQARD